jgi:hypothetical protein
MSLVYFVLLNAVVYQTLSLRSARTSDAEQKVAELKESIANTEIISDAVSPTSNVSSLSEFTASGSMGASTEISNNNAISPNDYEVVDSSSVTESGSFGSKAKGPDGKPFAGKFILSTRYFNSCNHMT